MTRKLSGVAIRAHVSAGPVTGAFATISVLRLLMERSDRQAAEATRTGLEERRTPTDCAA